LQSTGEGKVDCYKVTTGCDSLYQKIKDRFFFWLLLLTAACPHLSWLTRVGVVTQTQQQPPPKQQQQWQREDQKSLPNGLPHHCIEVIPDGFDKRLLEQYILFVIGHHLSVVTTTISTTHPLLAIEELVTDEMK
jgi:hypothetical protein